MKPTSQTQVIDEMLRPFSLTNEVGMLGLVAQAVRDGPTKDVINGLKGFSDIAILCPYVTPLRIAVLGVYLVLSKDPDFIRSFSVLGSDSGVASLAYGYLSSVDVSSSEYVAPFFFNLREYAKREPPPWLEPAMALHTKSIDKQQAVELCDRLEGNAKSKCLRAVEAIDDPAIFLDIINEKYRSLYTAPMRSGKFEPMFVFSLAIQPFGALEFILIGCVENNLEIVSEALKLAKDEAPNPARA